MARKGSPRPGQSAWSAELREAFLALLRETGNARASARVLGHPHLFNNHIQRDPDFRRACRAATAEVDARLRDAAGPFLAPVEVKSMPPEDEMPQERSPEKRNPTSREPVIRKTSNGRTQISYVRDGFWNSEAEGDFLARLRATGNFDASARAIGFHPTSVYKRLARWPAFAKDCKDALDEAEVQLDYRLVAHAHSLLRKPADRPDDNGEEDETAFDPEVAMRIIGFLDKRKNGGTTRGRRKGPPERSFEEAVESILGKIEAIEKHEALMKARGEAGEA